VSKGRLVECSDLARPERFSGLDTVAVSLFEMGSALQSPRTLNVIAGGQQIYPTDTSTYVFDDRLDPRRLTAKDEPAQVNHRAIGREYLQRIG
jgi:hypothetical protein